MLMHLSLLLCTCLTHSARVKPAFHSIAQHKAENATVLVQKGMLLRDRYRLEEYSHTHHRATPGSSFPSISSKRGVYDGPEHLGTGSFGDVWKAWDTSLNKMVAVKIFYQEVRGDKRYMTWKNADARGKRELDDSNEECTFVQKIMENRRKYPLGASRICECYKAHIDDAKGTNDVVFLVQEMCGRDLETKFIKPRRRSGRLNTWKARMVTKQMLQGIAFLQMFNPPLIHHDLKPANVCMNDEGEVKIIDWGGIVQGTYSNKYKPAVATPLYTPPEAKTRLLSFDSPYWSYDLYAIGLMHMELVCPTLTAQDWYYYTPMTSSTFTSVVDRKCGSILSAKVISEEVHIMANLAAKRPADRPNPMSFLDDSHLVDVPTPQVKEEEKVNVLAFTVGQKIEYWSTTHQEWLAGTVGAVNSAHGTYDLLKRDGEVMRKGADPSRVRAPTEVLDASVDVRFVPRHSRIDGNEAGGIDGANLLIPIKEEAPESPYKNPHGRLERIPTSYLIEVERPSVYGSIYTGFSINTFVKGNDVQSIVSVTLECKYAVPAVEPVPFEIKELGNDLHLWSARVKLEPKDPRENQLCLIVATVVMKDGTRAKSYPQSLRVKSTY